uniref:Uncharacterized protein n=1 Tax=Arundo donax TaxID=35708 RepID=A0A0A9C6T7_ARUDO
MWRCLLLYAVLERATATEVLSVYYSQITPTQNCGNLVMT